MNNRVMKFGYEDTDKKIEIEIYGLRFEIKNLDSKNVEELKKVDRNLDSIEKEIENILGTGSVEKINNKRVSDGHDKMTLDVELAILGCVFETYANALTNNMTKKVTDTVETINNKMNNVGNRQQRRNYNRYNNNRYRRY